MSESINKGKIADTEEDAWQMQDTQEGKPHAWIQWKGTDVCNGHIELIELRKRPDHCVVVAERDDDLDDAEEPT